jgi:hypothetical protein
MDVPSNEVGDAVARELYLSAGLDFTRAHGAPRLAAALLGENFLNVVRQDQLPCRALIGRSGFRWIIHVRGTLNARQLNHAIAHELGEWFLRCRGYTEPDVEELSSRVAAAICVPRPAFDAVYAQLGEDIAALSQRFLVSESLMVLRLAECLGVSTALVTEKVVLTRGEPRAWPTTPDGWTKLVDPARANDNGLMVRTLTDESGRIALRFR